jgi:hypothetical protein
MSFYDLQEIAKKYGVAVEVENALFLPTYEGKDSYRAYKEFCKTYLRLEELKIKQRDRL